MWTLDPGGPNTYCRTSELCTVECVQNVLVEALAAADFMLVWGA